MTASLSTPRHRPARQHWLKRLIYLAVMIALTVFLLRLGPAPWLHMHQHWLTLLLVMCSTGAGLVVQAQSFRAVSTEYCPSLRHTTAIWSASAVVSVVAPVFAGIATRTGLLMQAGVNLSACASTSLRQVWMGLEYALLLAALSLPFSSWPFVRPAAAIALLCWVVMLLLRSHTALLKEASAATNRVGRALAQLRQPVPIRAHLWFILQILAMAATYHLGFNGLGAELSPLQAVALGALTVILSIIVFVPNGLGITDAIWVIIATDAGLSMEHAVAIAITLRLAHLLASILVHLSTRGNTAVNA